MLGPAATAGSITGHGGSITVAAGTVLIGTECAASTAVEITWEIENPKNMKTKTIKQPNTCLLPRL